MTEFVGFREGCYLGLALERLYVPRGTADRGISDLNMTAGIPEIELRYLYRLDAELDTKMEIGTGPYGFRRCVTIAGGAFEGDRMKGVVL